MIQNDRKLCLLCSISQELYIIYSSFDVHKCKMISPDAFFIFLKFRFSRLLGESKAKKWHKMIKTSVCHAICLRNHSFLQGWNLPPLPEGTSPPLSEANLESYPFFLTAIQIGACKLYETL